MRDYEPYYTEDGSIGLYSYADKDVYHSKFGALTEAWEKFVIPSGVDNLINNQEEINVLDICYGIGYNTKALMTYVLNKNKNFVTRKNIFQKISNIVSKYTNKLKMKNDKLLTYDDTVYDDNFVSKFNIDCLDINVELVKLSPMFRTIKTPEEIYSDIVPDILNCFETYYKLKDVFVNFASKFSPKNKKEIRQLLEIRYKNMHINKEYKVNPIVNYILLNVLADKYGKKHLSKNVKKVLKEKYTSKFFDKSYIKYAKFNHKWGYNLSSCGYLSTFLHNIYYRHLSNRYKKIDFKAAMSLFNIVFYLNDARKSIFKIDKQYDFIFLDAFTYTKSPQLWSYEFIAELTKRLNEHGVLLTYSNSAQVRNTFLENNLYVGKIFNDKTGEYIGTIASKDKSKIEYPLNNFEMGLCNTKAGIPYHDPNLRFSKQEILELREYEFRNSNLLSSSMYMKQRSEKGENYNEEI